MCFLTMVCHLNMQIKGTLLGLDLDLQWNPKKLSDSTEGFCQKWLIDTFQVHSLGIKTACFQKLS